MHRLPRATLRRHWAGMGCPVGAQRCCPVGISGTQTPRPPDITLPRVAWTKCPGGAAARGARENVERSVRERSASASCRCATPTREALSGPPDVSSIGEIIGVGRRLLQLTPLQASTTETVARQDMGTAFSPVREKTQRNGSRNFGQFEVPKAESEITVKKLGTKLAKTPTQVAKARWSNFTANRKNQLAECGNSNSSIFGSPQPAVFSSVADFCCFAARISERRGVRQPATTGLPFSTPEGIAATGFMARSGIPRKHSIPEP